MSDEQARSAGPEEDQRSRRLVTMQVSFDLVDGQGLKLEGLTTGLNENGLAGRLNVVHGHLPEPLIGHQVQISLDLPKEREFLPIHGSITRLEPSWVPGFRWFVAIRFDRISREDIEYLRRFVKWREDRYFRQGKPPRSWYIFANGEQQQYGPLTTAEVLSAVQRGAFTESDLIWSAERGEWVKFSQGVFAETASVHARKSRLTVLAAALAVCVAVGSLVGYRQGWLDYSMSARDYREGCRLMDERNLHLAIQKFNDLVRRQDGSRWSLLAAEAVKIAHRRMNLAQTEQVAKERLELLQRIPVLKQTHPLVLNNFGDCYYRLGDFPKALEYFMQSLEKNPESKRLHFNIGTVYLRMGNFQAALSHFERVTDEITNLPDLFINKGITLLALGRRREAMEAFDKAARLNPEDEQLQSTIAKALAAPGWQR